MTKPFRILLGGAMFICSSALGQLQWDERVLEIRPALQETNVMARFTFKNVGTRVVTIASVRTSCSSCTTARLAKTAYLRGESGTITVNFAWGERTGLQVKNVLVQSDDPEEPTAALTLRVHIPELVKITPLCIFWQVGDEKTTKTMTFRVLLDSPVKVLRVRSNNQRMALELKEKQAGREYQIQVTPTDTDQPVVATLEFETDYPAKNPRTFHAFAQIRPPPGTTGFTVTPSANTKVLKRN